MNKRIQGFIAGSVVTALVLTGSTVFAESVEALFNQINIKVSGNQIASVGDNYTLSNGETTPFSISYNGTTYLPMRKVAELLGKDIQWDDATNTADIVDKGSISNNTSELSPETGYNRDDINGKFLTSQIVYKEGDRCYLIGNTMSFEGKYDGNYHYITLYSAKNLNTLLNIAMGKDKIEVKKDSDNKYVAGKIDYIKNFDLFSKKEIATGINTGYFELKYSNPINNKNYEQKTKTNSIYTECLPMELVFESLGIEYNITQDDENNLIYISFSGVNRVESDGFVSYSGDYKEVYFKIDNDGLYQVSNFDTYNIYSNNGKYYMSDSEVISILNLLGNGYKIEKSNNPNLKGNLISAGISKYSGDTKREYYDANTTYYTGSIYDITDKTKSINFSTKPGAEQSAIEKSADISICLDDVLNYFGYKDKVKVEFDDANKNVIIVLNK